MIQTAPPAGQSSYPATARHRQWTRPQIAAAILVSVLFVAARVYWATISTLEPDEAFSLVAVRHSWADLFRAITGDLVHPPLFYVLLKLWLSAVGETLLALRLLPILTSLASLAPMYLLCRELSVPASASNLAVFLVAANPFLVRYSQELRMYSLLVLLGLCSLWLFVRFSRAATSSRAVLVALTAVNLLLVYTHYNGWFLVAVEGAYLLWRERSRFIPFCGGMLLVGLLFLAWAAFVVSQAKTGGGFAAALQKHLGWNMRPAWRDVVTFYSELNGPFRSGLSFSKGKVLAGLTLFGLPIALAFWKRIRPGSRPVEASRLSISSQTLDWLLFFAFAPVVLTYAVSWILPVSIFGSRYLILTSVPYLILSAACILSLRPATVRAGIAALAVVWSAFGFVDEVRLEDRVNWVSLIESMRSAETLNPSAKQPVPFYVLTHPEPIRYTLERVDDNRFFVKPGRLYALERRSDGSSVMKIGNFEELRDERFWLAYQESFWYPEATERLRRRLADGGYERLHDFQSGLQGHEGHVGLFERPASNTATPAH